MRGGGLSHSRLRDARRRSEARARWDVRPGARSNNRSARRSFPEISSPAAALAGTESVPAGGRGSSRFLLQALLGIGGVCEVYAALDLRRAEWSDANPGVALKRLLPEMRCNYQAQLFLAQEFSILRHLSHHGVVRVFDLHQEPFGLCYSMELLEGATLTIAPCGMGEAGYAAVAELFGVLAYLHGRGVAHGDIKPSNILLESAGRLVLIDFNTAALAEAGEGCRTARGRGLRRCLRIPAHSALYSSPECLAGHAPTPAADVFSACCTVYEFLSGRHPFGGARSCEALRSGVEIPPPEGMPKALWLRLRRGLDADPAQRPHAASLHDRFAALCREGRLLRLLRRYIPL